MDQLAYLLQKCPSLLVGRIPLAEGTLIIGDPYFVEPAGVIALPVVGQTDGAVHVVRAAVPGWGWRNLAAWLRLRKGSAPGRLEPLTGSLGQHVFQSDTGLGAYMDRPSLEAFLAHRAAFRRECPAKNYHGEVLAPLLRRSAENPQDEWDAGSRALVSVPGASGAAIAVFTCGLGAGGFCSFGEWAGDELVGIVTDFAVPATTGIALDEIIGPAPG